MHITYQLKHYLHGEITTTILLNRKKT